MATKVSSLDYVVNFNSLTQDQRQGFERRKATWAADHQYAHSISATFNSVISAFVDLLRAMHILSKSPARAAVNAQLKECAVAVFDDNKPCGRVEEVSEVVKTARIAGPVRKGSNPKKDGLVRTYVHCVDTTSFAQQFFALKRKQGLSTNHVEVVDKCGVELGRPVNFNWYGKRSY